MRSELFRQLRKVAMGEERSYPGKNTAIYFPVLSGHPRKHLFFFFLSNKERTNLTSNTHTE